VGLSKVAFKIAWRMAAKCASCSLTDLPALEVLALLALACAVMAARTAGADMALEANSVGLRLCANRGT